MKQTKQFLRPLLMAIVMMVGMLVPQGAWAITLLTEEGDEVWCEDMAVALYYLTSYREMGYNVTTMLFDENIALSEEFDLSLLGQDITIDLHGHVLTNEPGAAFYMRYIVAFCGCDYRITIQNGTIESNELDAIYFNGINNDPNYQLVLKNVKVVTRQEGRYCLFDATPEDWEDWGNYGLERTPKLQIIDSEFHSNGCSAISFTLQSNDECVKSILPVGYSFYNANTDVELVEYADRPLVDEKGNPATDIRTGRSQDLPKVKFNDSEDYYGNFKQAMDCNDGEFTLTLLDDVKEGLCTTNYGKSVTIDLNGHTLDITRLYAYEGKYLNIIDSSEGKTGRLIVERFDVETPAENNAVIEGEVTTWVNRFTNNGLVEYVYGSFINNGDFITSWTWADDHSSATLRINHEDVDAVVTNEDTTPATCIASGVRTYTAAATYRDRNYADTKDEEIAIDPNAHDYKVQQDENENPVFVWSEDYTTATLQVVCLHHAEHTANVEVTGEGITSEDTTPATCTTAGVRTYTATATYKGETYTGTKEVEIPATGHDYTNKTLTASPVEDGLYAYACENGCGAHNSVHIIKDFNGIGNRLKLSKDGEGNYCTSSDVILDDGTAFATPVKFTVPSDQIKVERTFTASKPATVMLPFSIEASLVQGATFSEFGGVSYDEEKAQWVATMTSVSTTLLAYTPYIVMLDEGNVTGKVTFGNESADVATFVVTPDASTMQTADANGWTFKAVNAAKTWAEGDPEIGKAYGFAGKDKTVGENEIHRGDFVKIAAGASAKPGRCYLVKNDGEPLTRATEELPATIKVRFIVGSATGIGTLDTETGEMTLEGWYDLNGNKIEQPSKGGVYINNNKKVMVK